MLGAEAFAQSGWQGSSKTSKHPTAPNSSYKQVLACAANTEREPPGYSWQPGVMRMRNPCPTGKTARQRGSHCRPFGHAAWTDSQGVSSTLRAGVLLSDLH